MRPVTKTEESHARKAGAVARHITGEQRSAFEVPDHSTSSKNRHGRFRESDTRRGIIIDVEATAAHRTEKTVATKMMIDRVEDRFGIKPTRLIGDTPYGTRAQCWAGS